MWASRRCGHRPVCCVLCGRGKAARFRGAWSSNLEREPVKLRKLFCVKQTDTENGIRKQHLDSRMSPLVEMLTAETWRRHPLTSNTANFVNKL